MVGLAHKQGAADGGISIEQGAATAGSLVSVKPVLNAVSIEPERDASSRDEGGGILPNISPPRVAGGKRYGYMIGTLNRTEPYGAGFQANYLILGKSAPRVEVKTNKAGVELREFSFSNIEMGLGDIILSVGSFLLVLLVFTPYLCWSADGSHGNSLLSRTRNSVRNLKKHSQYLELEKKQI